MMATQKWCHLSKSNFATGASRQRGVSATITRCFTATGAICSPRLSAVTPTRYCPSASAAPTRTRRIYFHYSPPHPCTTPHHPPQGQRAKRLINSMGKVRNKGGAPLQCSGGVTTMIGVLESNHSRDALRLILKGLQLATSGLKAECAARLAAYLAENPKQHSPQPWAAAALTKVSNMFRNIPEPTLTAPHTPNQHDARPPAPPSWHGHATTCPTPTSSTPCRLPTTTLVASSSPISMISPKTLTPTLSATCRRVHRRPVASPNLISMIFSMI